MGAMLIARGKSLNVAYRCAGRTPGRLNRRLGGIDRGEGRRLQRLSWHEWAARGPDSPYYLGPEQGYLYLQFRDFQKGARKDDRMTPIAQGVGKEDALALAEYFAAKPWPGTNAAAASKADVKVAMTAINSVVSRVAT